MATYDELLAIVNGGPAGAALYGRVKVACLIACEAIRNEMEATANHANRMLWAAEVLRDPDVQAKRMLLAVLAQNNAVPIASITGASDGVVQTAVNAAVNLIAQG
jgi:hypothetical protein